MKLTAVALLCFACWLLPSVKTEACTNDQDVRLGDAVNNDQEGRAEICKSGVYYQICDDGWSQNDAKVFCNMLGYSSLNAQASGLSNYGSAALPVDKSNYQCDGSEDTLSACTASTGSNCGTDHIAGVKCFAKGQCEAAGHTGCCTSGCNAGGCFCDSACYGFGDCCDDIADTCPQGTPVSACTTNEVRLVEGFANDGSDGRVEFCLNGQWTTICNDDNTWNSLDSQVVCSQVGVPQSNPAVYIDPVPYGQGDMGIFVKSFQCDGSETYLNNCSFTSTGVDCGHQFDVGVSCSGSCTNGDVLINGANSDMMGYVLLCVSGSWEYISDNSWGLPEAQVVCGGKGFSSSNVLAFGGAKYGTPKKEPTLSSFGCFGNETALSGCAYTTITNGDLSSVASVQCSAQTICEAAGHSGCCTSGCNGGGCFCDSACHIFNDCCDGIDSTCPNGLCTEGEIRVVDGISAYEGRVEVCINGKFGPICDNGWDNLEATVVCNQMNYNLTGAKATVGSYFPQSNLTFVAGDFTCLGNEQSLTECGNSPPTCGHNNEAGVRCIEACTIAGDVRLVGGEDEYEGRVEICQDGTWQSICQGSAWSQEDAVVTCRQLGHSLLSVVAYGNSYYGEGVGGIAATNLQCAGTEESLSDCPKTISNTCDHSTDVGVDCTAPIGPCQTAGFTTCCTSGCNVGSCYCDATCYTFGDCCYEDIAITCPQNQLAPCTDDEIRISGGDNTNKGLVEFCVDGEWTSICDDGWDTNEANVVCAEAGFSTNGAIAIAGSYFGQDGGPIVKGNFQCDGSESSLSSCSNSDSTCAQHNGAGVVCPETCTTDGEVRLVGGEDDTSGYVEVCTGGSWGAICDTNWCEQNAMVICSQMGYSTNRAEAYGGSYFGQDVVSIQYNNVQCNGDEATITDCSNSSSVPETCGTKSLAGVKCFEKSACENNGINECCISGCNAGGCYCDGACHGFGDCCDGIDNTCPSTSSCTNGLIRLADGNDMYEGRLEMCVDGQWGTVCDQGFGTPDAKTACAQLKLPFDDVTVFPDAYFGQGDTPVVASGFLCGSQDTKLSDCGFASKDSFCCGHHRDVGIRCIPGCIEGSVKLDDGNTELEGTVKVCIDGSYQAICDDLWSVNDAAVICRDLGYSAIDAHAFGYSYFNNNSLAIPALTNVECTGDEDSWIGCQYSENPTCDPTRFAGVRCTSVNIGGCEAAGFTECCVGGCNAGGCYCDQACHGFGDCCDDIEKLCPSTAGNCSSGDVRIANGFSAEEFGGRVEVCINGEWGSICDDGWGLNEAHVVCSQFGYTSYGSVPAIGAVFGQSSFPIVAGNYSCKGFESSIYDCSYSASPDCGHHEDAGVYCNVKCTDNEARIVNSTSIYEGRVEVCHNGTWHPVCDELWSTEDSIVLCGQLGFSAVGAQAFGHSLYGKGLTPVMPYGYNCTGNENNLTNCMILPATMCDSDSSAGASCSGEPSQCELNGHTGCCISGCNAGGCYCDAFCHNFGDCCDGIDVTCPQATCTTGDMRLVGGSSDSRGRVETCVNEQWGTVCDDGWDNNDAAIVCNQLGYPTQGAAAKGGAYFGQGSDDIVAGGFQCEGTESTLLDCVYSSTPSCGHQQDAGVICPEQCYQNGDLRLTDGPSDFEGRFEVCLFGQWSSVCADDDFCTASANVVCKQLGYSPKNAEAYGLAKYGEAGGFVGLEHVVCLGTEDNFTQCQSTVQSECPHTLDAGVKCQEISPCELAGHTSCCTSGCFNSQYFCWCDSSCHFFNDCCDNIEATCPSASCNDGDKRLVSGDNDTSGILNVCKDSKWSTVCGLSFDEGEAKVACRAQGLDEAGFTILSTDYYGQGEGPVFAKETQCTGSEYSLNDCAGNDGCCSHSRDVGLTCEYACQEGEIRLVGGDTPNEGRVEVCFMGRFGTVCDDLWGVNDARVACKMAGLPWRGAVATTFANFGEGVGPIFLDNVECDGTEGTLWNCSYSPIHNCAHFEDAGVQCAPGPCETAGYTDGCCDSSKFDCQGSQEEAVCHCDTECEIHGDCCVDFDLICQCTEGDIRLVNGGNEKEGRVEVCINGQYGTVCDDLFGINDGRVVCRQLGYPNASVEVFSLSYFGQGTGLIVMDNVQCTGDEANLIDCPYIGSDGENCIHFEDVSVRCSDSVCTDGEVRLADGDSQYAGRLEICLNGVWGTVCDDLFSDNGAQVACKSLNLPSDSAFWFRSPISFPQATGAINLDNVQCAGTEEHILDCPHITNHNCVHFEDVAVVCNPGCKYNGEVRLVGGTDETNGRLEVCVDHVWGTVCDDGFDNDDAKVACRQLGLPTGSPRSLLNLQYGAGYGDIQYNQLQCTGNETHLINCTKQGSGFFCFHGEDVGISCEPGCTDGQIKLVGGKADTEGRVEVCRGGSWGTICDNSGSWGIHEARVTCRQLGFPETAAQADSSFGSGGDPLHYSNVNCDGSELNIASCSKITDVDSITCTHGQDVGVTCEEACTNNEVRLVDGTDQTNGRFEICLGGTWGTVCDEEFHNIDARIVCKQLGHPYAGAEAVFGGVFGIGDDSIAISNLHCVGTEDVITDCFFTTGSDVSTCSHANDIGIICQGLCTNGDIRLADGVSSIANAPPNSGRVEVCFNGEWGTICETGWSTKDGQVTCGQLGFNNEAQYVRTFGGYKYGAGIGEIYFASVDCTGSETCLVTCPSSTDTSACTHDKDVGLRCDGTFTPSDLSVDEKCPTSCNLPAPSVVTNVTVDIEESTKKVEIRWEEPMESNGIITGYNFTVTGHPTLNMFVSGGSAKYIKFDFLESGIPYSYKIIPYNLCGGNNAVTGVFFTGEEPPNAPTITSSTRLSGKSFSVQWDMLSLSDARGQLSSYEVSWAVAGSSDYSTIQIASDMSTYTHPADDSLEVDKQYTVRVRGRNGAGFGAYSSPFTLTTTNSVLIQLKIFLLPSQICGTWLEDASTSKATDIIKELSDQIASRCNNCGFNNQYITGSFHCSSENQEVHFRGHLYSTTSDIESTDIASNIDDWLLTEPKVTVDGVSFEVDSDCVVVIETLDDSFCPTNNPQSSVGGAVIGSSIAVTIVVIILFAGLVIIIVVLVRRVRPGKYGTNDASNEIVGYSNQMAFPDGGEDNISQRASSTIHDDDFQQAINMISDEVDQDMDKQKLSEMYDEQGKLTFSGDR